ncbi:MAG TPA: hypothetical protein VN081_02395 [Dongiaceae bacterium]|nr:hypothetical protein [Dongiaceae bacterium]
MTPDKIAKPGNEDSHQIAIGAWAANHVGKWPELAWLFHVPNGGARNAREGAKFKTMLVRPGVSDLHLNVARRGYHGLVIELKHDALGLDETQRDKMVSDVQKNYLTFVNDQGYYGCVAYGWEMAVATIEWYLNGDK